MNCGTTCRMAGRPGFERRLLGVLLLLPPNKSRMVFRDGAGGKWGRSVHMASQVLAIYERRISSYRKTVNIIK